MSASLSAARVAVVAAADGLHTIAARPFAAGEEVLQLNGVVVARPTRYTVQLDADAHLEVPPGLTAEAVQREHAWRFLDHACAPNAVLRGRQLVALRTIAAGEPVTFDYNTTELALAHPFACRCGADGCVGRVAGFAALTPEQQRRRLPLLAPHLRALLAEPTV